MFDIGFLELVIVAVVGLVVIGPERLPGVARSVGKWVGRTRRFIDQVKSDIDREIKQEELRKALEDDAGLDEIKQIINSDRYTIEDEEKPDYLVKATSDEQVAEAARQASTNTEAEPTEAPNDTDTVKQPDEPEKPER